MALELHSWIWSMPQSDGRLLGGDAAAIKGMA
jgi:hypothetical protein